MSEESELGWRGGTFYELYLDFLFQLSFEASPDDFSLTGLEAVRNTRDRANVVCHGEENQFLVDKIGI